MTLAGIGGIWNLSGGKVPRAALEILSESLSRPRSGRGEIFCRKSTGFAQCRRFPPAVREAKQKCGFATGHLRVAWDGTLWNADELRDELAGKGVRLRSPVPEEILIRSYEVWGPACFPRFRGVWAMAFWDGRSERLTIARDPLGIRPLFYAASPDRFVFASETGAIHAAFPEERQVNHRELCWFLEGGSPDAGEETFFRNIRSVPPGSFIAVGPGKRETVTYWSPLGGEEIPREGLDETFRTLVRQAIFRQTEEAHPFSVLTSGGLDSTVILRTLAGVTEKKISCVALRYDEDRDLDESGYTAAAADDLEKYDIHWVTPDPRDMLTTMADIVRVHDGPTPLRGRFAQWFLLKEAVRHGDTVFDGTGPDELLAGYPNLVVPYLADRVFLRDGEEKRGAADLISDIRGLMKIGVAPLDWFRIFSVQLFLRRVTTNLWPLTSVLSRDFVLSHPPVPPERCSGTWFRSDVEKPFKSRLNNALWLTFRYSGLPEMLRSSHVLSRAFALDLRMPFLDPELVRFCFRLPWNEKIRDGWTKSLLRRSFSEDLPAPIRFRRHKLGMPAPVFRWMTMPGNYEEIRHLLLSARSLQRGILDEKKLSRLLPPRGRPPASHRFPRPEQLWRLVMTELWLRKCVDGL